MKDVTVLRVPVFGELCNLGFSFRRKVYIEEQQVPADEEFEVADLAATHIVAIGHGDVCGYLRALLLPEHAKIGRVVVAQYTVSTALPAG